MSNAEIATIVEDDQTTDIASFLEDFNNDKAGVVTTLDLNDLEGQDDAMAAMTTAEGIHDALVALPNKDKDAGIQLDLVDFIITESEALDEDTGLVRDTLRIILIGAEGEAFSTGSMPVARSLRTIKALRDRAGVSLRERPVKIRLVHTLTRNKRTAIALQVVRAPKK